MVEIACTLDKKDELINTVRREALPILKKQSGFLELLPLVPEVSSEHRFVMTLWADKRDLEKYVMAAFSTVEQVLKPLLTNSRDGLDLQGRNLCLPTPGRCIDPGRSSGNRSLTAE